MMSPLTQGGLPSACDEKIKVTLSRKRCRGTLQGYHRREINECQSKQWTNKMSSAGV